MRTISHHNTGINRKKNKPANGEDGEVQVREKILEEKKLYLVIYCVPRLLGRTKGFVLPLRVMFKTCWVLEGCSHLNNIFRRQKGKGESREREDEKRR